MQVDGGEVEFAGDDEEFGFHGLKSVVSAGLSFGGLEQFVDSFNEAVGLARSGPGDDANTDFLAARRRQNHALEWHFINLTDIP
jgi:hypothetical protein